MNLSRGIHAILSIGVVSDARRFIDRAGDERNVRALARHLGCSNDEARRLYAAARKDGYGAAFQQVFPQGRASNRDPSTRGVSVDVRGRKPGSDQRVHH
jgi:methylphosphotriester-DNA--protein-cysteine methyltransferase